MLVFSFSCFISQKNQRNNNLSPSSPSPQTPELPHHQGRWRTTLENYIWRSEGASNRSGTSILQIQNHANTNPVATENSVFSCLHTTEETLGIEQSRYVASWRDAHCVHWKRMKEQTNWFPDLLDPKDPYPFFRVGLMVPIPSPTIGLVRFNPEILGHTYQILREFSNKSKISEVVPWIEILGKNGEKTTSEFYHLYNSLASGNRFTPQKKCHQKTGSVTATSFILEMLIFPKDIQQKRKWGYNGGCGFMSREGWKIFPELTSFIMDICIYIYMKTINTWQFCKRAMFGGMVT